jgi:hypothetical protein
MIRFATAASIALVAVPGMVGAQQAEVRMGSFEQPVANRRDGDFNRSVTRGGTAGPSAVSIANSVSVSQGGRGNTLTLIVDQRNSGAVTSGISMNGELELD